MFEIGMDDLAGTGNSGISISLEFLLVDLTWVILLSGFARLFECLSLLSGEILELALNRLLEGSDHVVESLFGFAILFECLLSNTGHEYVLFQTHFFVLLG